MDTEMDQHQKLIARIAKLMDEQTIAPTKKDVNAAVSKYYSDQKQNRKTAAENLGEEPKKKRQLSEYNIFFQEQMAILKDETMTAKAKMQHVASLWRAKKGNTADDVEAGIEDDEDEM
jgi:hypothetical protein